MIVAPYYMSVKRHVRKTGLTISHTRLTFEELNMSTEFYVRYHVHGFGDSPLVRYAGPYPFEHVAESHQKDIGGYEGISDCIIIDKKQFELDQTMNNQESS
jgi:hypothetical protein